VNLYIHCCWHEWSAHKFIEELLLQVHYVVTLPCLVCRIDVTLILLFFSGKLSTQLRCGENFFYKFLSKSFMITTVKKLRRSSAIAEGPRDASCQLKSCQLPRNSAETTCTTSPEQIEVIKLEGYSGPMCNKHVHSTMTRSSRFHCHKQPTTDKLSILPVYRRLAVAKFSKFTM